MRCRRDQRLGYSIRTLGNPLMRNADTHVTLGLDPRRDMRYQVDLGLVVQ